MFSGNDPDEAPRMMGDPIAASRKILSTVVFSQ
jgi:hypothetical protein